MALRIVLGSSGSGKTHFMCEEMLKNIKKDNSCNYIYIVPEQFTMETQKKMVKMQRELFSLSGIMNIDIVSFNRLSFRVFEELGVNRLSILDDTGKTLILRKIIEDNRNELNVYKDKSGMLGFITEMKSAISELYQYGIDVDKLEDIIAGIDGHNMTKGKLGDIMTVYKYFREYVSNMTDSEAKYITKEEVLDELCRYIEKSDWIKKSRIVLDGYTGFTPVQMKVISLLLEYGIDVTVSVTIRTDNLNLTNVGFVNVKEQELFNMSKDMVNKLYALANEKRIPISEPVIIEGSNGRHKKNEELRFIEKNIFDFNEKVYKEKPDSIEIYRSANNIAEAKNITDIILKLIKEDKTLRYRDIAVITGDDGLMMTLDRFMSMADIPHFVDNKKSIIRNPFVDTIRAVLEIIDTDFRYESVFKYLRCYMTDISAKDIDILENYVLALGIRGKKRYKAQFTKMYKGIDEEDLSEIEEIRKKFVYPVLKLADKMKDKNVREVTKSIYEFVCEINLKDKIKRYISIFEETNENSLQAEYSQVYKKVMELFDKLVLLLGDEKISLSEYRKILDAGFEEIKVGIIPLSIDELIIGDIERTRLGEIKYLFIAGANDGIIPKHSTKGGLLSQSDRALLKDLSVTLSPTIRENSFIQRFYLYLSVTKPTDKIIVTYSDCGSDGSAIRPSYLIDILKDLFAGNEIERTVNRKNISELANKSSVFDMLLENIKYYGSEEFSSELMEILSYSITDEELGNRLKKGIEGAFFTNKVEGIEGKIAKQIYGEDTVAKATRLEKYAACAYAHFMEYGLKLVERPVYEIKATDIGTLYHNCVEAFTRRIKNEKIDINTIDDNRRQKLIHECMEQIAISYENGVFFSNKRNQFLFEKCEKVADRTAWVILEHLKKGKFSMDYLELSVTNGRIDRVDSLEIDGTKYIKIIDYKSGSTKFSPVEVACGLKMQLMFYMNSVLEKERAENRNMRIEPAAVFYFNIEDPVLDFSEGLLDEDSYREKMLKEFTMSGFVNSRIEVFEGIDSAISENTKQSVVFGMNSKNVNCQMNLEKHRGAGSCYNFENFIDYVKNMADDFANEIVEGNISLKPYKMGTKTACTYCKYKGICSFDCRSFNNSYNYLFADNKENIDKLQKKLNKEINLSNGSEQKK